MHAADPLSAGADPNKPWRDAYDQKCHQQSYSIGTLTPASGQGEHSA
jgi:hypothetical protein